MNTNQKSKLLIDVVLFVIFIGAFFLDLTGTFLHQVIGAVAGVIAAYHLITHWNWVTAVSRRLFGRTSGRARLNYLVDAALMLSGVVAVGTGLVISTWFNLSLANYDVWHVVHIASSIGMLAVTVLKLVLHWRWLQEAVKNIFTRRAAPVQPVIGVKLASRRAFLGAMGAVGVASAFAMTNAVKGLQLPQASEVTLAPQIDTISASDVIVAYSPQSAATSTAPAATATALPPASTSTTPAATPTANQTQNTVASACTVRCPRGCSYPGRCRKYTDANGNNKCDLGECL